MNRPVPSRSGTFHRGIGRPLRCTNIRASASATERTPALISRSTSRGNALPRPLPEASSSFSSAAVHRPRWTTSARA